MTKLLNANFRRLWRSKTFWIGLVLACAHTLLGVINNLYYKNAWVDQSAVITADHTLFPDTLITIIIMAVLVVMLVGREYTDKTIRNKIVTGHSRVSIYLANLIVCLTAAAILFIVPMLLIGLAVGTPLLGGFTLSFKAFILPFFCYLLGVFGFTSLFLLIVMSIQNRTVAAIVVLLLAAILVSVPTTLGEMLEAPERVEEVVWDENVEDFVYTGEMMENQAYVGGPARVMVQFLFDFLPGGTLQQTSPFNATKDMAALPIYAVSFIAVSTLGGAVIFKKKELK